MRFLILLFLSSCALLALGQSSEERTTDAETLPYYEIPAAPESFSATTIAARMIDGLGFRYYWGTEGLRPEDFNYQPSPEGRTILATMEHIHGLSNIVLNAVQGKANGGGEELEDKTGEGLRKATLSNLKTASDLLRAADPVAIENMNIIFERGDKTSEFPFWNVLNGPLADAIWHVGQIVSFRRAAGNPISGNISVFSGKVRKK